MSPGTLYHHFPSKEALIEAIILEDQERALTHFREPLEGVGLVDYRWSQLLPSRVKTARSGRWS